MKIEYYNQHGGAFGSANFLGEVQLLIADAATANDVWHNRQLFGVAPAGAVEARLVLQFVQPNNQTGAVHIDDVAFGITLTGDYNANGVVDSADYLVWKNSFGSTTDLSADGNHDGAVDAADYTVWRDNLTAALAANAAAGTIAPEPGGLALVAGALLGAAGMHARSARGDRAPRAVCHDATAHELVETDHQGH
jgi:hypothetical protein